MAKKRYHMMIANGMLTAASNAIKDSVLDPRGGGLDSFSVELQRVGGGGSKWWGASWVMEETNPEDPPASGQFPDTISFQVFERDIIDGLNMRWNTGAANTQIATYVHEDEFLGMSPRAGFDAALADTVKKANALEQVPESPLE